jgi:sugar phosphate isomerase/epimerase
MNRRKFLTGATAGAATIAAFGLNGGAQAPAVPAGGQAPAPCPAPGAEPARGGGGGRGGGGRGGGQAAGPAPPPALLGNPGAPPNVPAWKMARISLMQLNFGSVLLPNPSANNANPTAQNANQQYTVLDLPRVYVQHLGVHNIEFQLGNIVRCETEPAFTKELKAKLDEYKVVCSQINMEIGAASGMTADAAGRRAGIERMKRWIPICNELGCKRMMGNQNQGSLFKERFADAVAWMKEIADACRPHGIMFSMETRGAGQPAIPACSPGNPVNAPLVQDLGMKPWEFMYRIFEAAGAHSNVDIGNVGAMNQQELHDCIKRWYPRSSGNMHIKSNNAWNIGEAVRYTEGLGYKGLYAIEVGVWAGQRMTLNQILPNLKNQFQEYKP